MLKKFSKQNYIINLEVNMKKLLVAGTILLSASAFSTGVTAEFESRFNTLEQEYKMLMQKEDERYKSQ